MINAAEAKNLTEQSRRDSYEDILNDIDDVIKSTAQNGEYQIKYNYPKIINGLEITPTVKSRVLSLLRSNGYRINTSAGNNDEKDTENGYIDISWYR